MFSDRITKRGGVKVWIAKKKDLFKTRKKNEKMRALLIGPIKKNFFAASLNSSQFKRYFPSDYQSNFLEEKKTRKEQKIKEI